MLSDIKTNRKKQAILAGILVLVFGGAAYGGYAYLTKPEDKPKQPIRVEYCGAEPKQICVSSFGRDLEGNTIVNLYVPNSKTLEFNLLVQRKNSESVFDCKYTPSIKTTRYCTGENIPLNSNIKIQILAVDDGHLIGAGEFRLSSILVTAFNTATDVPVAETGTSISPADTGEPAVISNTPNSGGNHSGGASTPRPGNAAATPAAPAPTSSSGSPSYPGPSYP